MMIAVTPQRQTRPVNAETKGAKMRVKSKFTAIVAVLSALNPTKPLTSTNTQKSPICYKYMQFGLISRKIYDIITR